MINEQKALEALAIVEDCSYLLPTRDHLIALKACIDQLLEAVANQQKAIDILLGPKLDFPGAFEKLAFEKLSGTRHCHICDEPLDSVEGENLCERCYREMSAKLERATVDRQLLRNTISNDIRIVIATEEYRHEK